MGIRHRRITTNDNQITLRFALRGKSQGDFFLYPNPIKSI